MKYARIENGAIAELFDYDPRGRFNAALVFAEVADNAQVGQPYPPPPAPPKVSPVEFKLLFTAAERVAIKTARATDPVIDDFYDIVEDPRLTHVDLGLQSTQDALAYLEAQGLITAERRVQILAGQVQ